MTARFVVIALFLSSAAFPVQASEPTIDGLWLTDGYGQLLEIKQNTLRMYELTGVSCIPAGSAKKQGNLKPGETVFASGPLGKLRFTRADGSGKLWMNAGGVSNVELRRLLSLPETCAGKVPDTPQINYEVFWQTFSEHYPFFALRHVDWAAVDRKFRPQVTSGMRPDELYGILRQMIEPLFDAHTAIDAKRIHKNFNGYREGTKPLQSKLAAPTNEIIRKKYLRGKLRSYCRELILGSKPVSWLHFGLLGDSIGYLRLDAFSVHCEFALDEIFGAAAELKGLIIDERLNVGGSDSFGIAIASRLTNRDYLAYSKVARNNVHDSSHRTAPQPVMVHASARTGFSGPVVLLTGPDSVSAAEVFAMALLGREPHITRVGESTQGVFSDVLERKLPNGWTFSLPNEIYLTGDGRAFDVTGLAPDIRAPVFPAQDLKEGRDGALEKAIELLRQAQRK